MAKCQKVHSMNVGGSVEGRFYCQIHIRRTLHGDGAIGSVLYELVQYEWNVSEMPSIKLQMDPICKIIFSCYLCQNFFI